MNQAKEYSDYEIYGKAVSLGAVAGLRAMLAPAMLSGAVAKDRRKTDDNLLVANKIPVVLGLLAVGELIGDKLPTTPNRTAFFGLSARIISGAIVGGFIGAKYKKSITAGAVLGAASAIAAAYAGENVRREAGKLTDIPDGLLGAVEDAIAIRIAAQALKD